MGGLLCKKNRNEDNHMNPVDRVIGHCPQICPQNKKKHFWEKQVLETSPPAPPLKQQPKLIKSEKESGWESATLTVPDSPSNGNVPPVAPPRKKRQSMSPKKEISRKAEQNILMEQEKSVQNTSNEDDSPKVESKEENLQLSSKENCSDQKLLNPKEVIVNVSNTEDKSDPQINDTKTNFTIRAQSSTENKEETSNQLLKEVKEDISVLSKDEVDNINMNQLEEEKCRIESKEVTDEMLREINKEKGNFIFALEKELKKEECPEYEGKMPVVEETIVPVKRKTKHICDDEERLKKLLHMDNDQDTVIPPKKPQRDFSKYKKSLETFKSEEITESSQNQSLDRPETISTGNHENKTTSDLSKDIINTTELNTSDERSITEIPVRKPLLQERLSETETIPADDILETESLLINPPKYKKKSDQSTSMAKDYSSERPAERPKRKSEIIAPNMSNSEKILRRCLSTQSYLTPDLVEKIAQQANSLSLTALYLPEDYSNSYNDGSGLVSPSFKLTEKRKISSQISRSSQGGKSEDDTTSEQNFTNEKTDEKIEDKQIIEEKINTEEEPINEINLSKIVQEPEESRSSDITSLPVGSIEITEKFTLEKEISETSEEIKENDQNQSERKLKRQISITNSSPEEISKTIHSFLNKNDLNPSDILQLLEDEFGDLLQSKHISEEDKKLLEQIHLSATIVPKGVTNLNISQETKTITEQSTNPSKENDYEKEMTEITQHKNEKSDESNVKSTTNTKPHHFSKIPKLKNKTLDSVAINEKRRHSIDELESWFSPKLSEKLDDSVESYIKRPRRREASLPNCLQIPEQENIKVPSLETPAPLRNKIANNTKTDLKKRESIGHSPLLKLLEKEKNKNNVLNN